MEELKVGDWVRYARVDSLALRDDGEIGQVDYVNENYDLVGVKWKKLGGFSNHNRRYLTKIQPPKKEKTVDIRRKEDGFVVHNVYETNYASYGWYHGDNYTTTYYLIGEWEPVEEWVTIEVYKSQWDKVDSRHGAFIAKTAEHKETGVCWRSPK